jgi:hypothetical protein
MAWFGGAVFVLSLGALAYLYLVRLAEPAALDEPLLLPTLANIALFTIFALHHSVMARTGAKQWLTARIQPAFERSVYVWIASVLAIFVAVGWTRVPGVLYELPGGLAWIGYAGQLAGVVLTWLGAAVLDPLELAGIRQVQGRVKPFRFRDDGPFGLVRHPIYLGWLLMVFGAPVMTVDRFVFATISSLYLILAIPWEERSLVEALGDRYRVYQQQVRWRLVPFVW